MLKGVSFLESSITMPLMSLPVRSTVVSLQDKKILFSPGSKLLPEQYHSLTDITDIIAPNLFHGGGVKLASNSFPRATKWGPEGISKKIKNIDWDQTLSEKSWRYEEELIILPILGIPKIKEFIFYHKESKSLIVTDFCFNLIDTKGFGPWLILSLFGTYKKFGISRFFLKFVEDPKLFTQSVSKLFEYDFDNILLSHGNNIIGNAKQQLQGALKDRRISLC